MMMRAVVEWCRCGKKSNRTETNGGKKKFLCCYNVDEQAIMSRKLNR